MARYPLDDWTLRNPISGVFGCCAREASGHDTAVPTRTAMNSRRLMASPAPRTTSGIKRISHFWIENCVVRHNQAAPNGRFVPAMDPQKGLAGPLFYNSLLCQNPLPGVTGPVLNRGENACLQGEVLQA
jgi:hypothetical protein